MTRRARWRAWRRSRPFWGGLLLILAGAELVLLPLSGVLVHGGLKLVIYIGIGGVFGVLIGALLVAAGTSLLVNPAHRSFYGIAGMSMAIAGGTESVMKFTADSVDLSGNVTVTVTQDGTTVTTVSATQDFSDGVTLYATKLSGSLLGVPLTFTPSTISAVLLTVANVATGLVPITMTGVTTDQLLISGGTQVTTQLSMS